MVAMLVQAAALRKGGLWSEAGAALDQAERRLEDIRDRHLGDGLRQARSDLLLAERLEWIRLNRTGGYWGKPHYGRAAQEYAAAFAAAGFTPADDPTPGDRIRRSAIRESVVAA